MTFSTKLYFFLLIGLVIFEEHVEGPRELRRKLSFWKKSDKYCDDDGDSNKDENDDFYHYKYEYDTEEDNESNDEIRELDEMLRRSNRRWYSFLKFKKTKKSRSSTGSFNKAEIKFMKKARKLFHKGNFVEAARCCTAAIKRNPNSENYLNRAICYLNSRKWNLAKNDLQTVLSKNPYHVRSNYLLGLVLLESKDFEAAVKHLQKAHDVGKEKLMNNDQILLIASQLEVAREKKREASEQNNLFSLLEKLMFQDTQRQINKIKNETGKNKTSENEISILELKLEKRKNLLISAFTEFNKVQNADQEVMEGDAPNYLCDKITYELLKEPVVVPSGMTYEKEVIFLYIDDAENDKIFDPITREPFFADQIIPNNALKEAVEAFLQENNLVNELQTSDYKSSETHCNPVPETDEETPP